MLLTKPRSPQRWPPDRAQALMQSSSKILTEPAPEGIDLEPAREAWLRWGKLDREVTEQNCREACHDTPGFAISESPTYVGRGVAALAADHQASRFAGHILTSRQLAGIYDVTDTDGSRPDFWSLVDAHGISHDSADGIVAFR